MKDHIKRWFITISIFTIVIIAFPANKMAADELSQTDGAPIVAEDNDTLIQEPEEVPREYDIQTDYIEENYQEEQKNHDRTEYEQDGEYEKTEYAEGETSELGETDTLDNAICQEAFSRTGIKGDIIIPDGIEEIGQQAFYHNNFEGELILSDSIRIIRDGAFCYSGITKMSDLPQNLEVLERFAFNNNPNLTGNIVIPSKITVLPEGVFGATNLTSLTLHDDITEIGGSAFYKCKNLKGDLTLPKNIKTVKYAAFSNCGFDGTLTIPEGAETINQGAFEECHFSKIVNNSNAKFINTSGGRYEEVEPTLGMFYEKEDGVPYPNFYCEETGKYYSSPFDKIGKGTYTLVKDYVPTETITLDGPSLDTAIEVNVGDTVDIIPTITPSNATFASDIRGYVWTGGGEVGYPDNILAELTVNKSGVKVKGLKPGYTTVSVYAEGYKIMTDCWVKVNGTEPEQPANPVEPTGPEIPVNPVEPTSPETPVDPVVPAGPIKVTNISLWASYKPIVHVGDTIQINADVSPYNADNKDITWKSSNTAIATVTQDGVVKGKKAGIVQITATSTDGSQVEASIDISVKKPAEGEIKVTSVKLDKKSADIKVNGVLVLIATILPENATNKTVYWSSSDKNVATVTSEGVVYGISKGTATITVTTNNGNKTAKCTINVKKAGSDIEPVPEGKQDINLALVTGVKDATYKGKEITQSPTVTLNGKTLKAETDYVLSYENNINAGTATLVVTGKGKYVKSIKVPFKINKAKNTIKATGKKIDVKYAKLAKKNQSISVKKAFKISKNNGKVTYKKKSGNKKITVSKSGKINIKKGLKKGKYKVKVKATAAGDKNHKSGTKTVTLTVQVK